MSTNCLFCKIVKKQIPCHKIIETESCLGFLDINPLNRGHALVIPKEHAQFMHQVSDATLSEMLPAVKKIALALGASDYNILQNNGRLAHQEVDHVHFHIIPKDSNGGLSIGWNVSPEAMPFAQLAKELSEKVSKF